MANHSRQGQTFIGNGIVVQIVAIFKVGVGKDGLSGNLIESDILGAQFYGGGDDHTVFYSIGIHQRPTHGLHPTQTAADHCGPAFDSQQVGQLGLAIHPVPGAQRRELGAPGFSGFGVDGNRTGGSVAAAKVIQANDKETIGVYGFARADTLIPPPGLFVVLVIAGGVVVTA